MALNNLTVHTDDADEFQRILDAAYKKYQDSIENLTDAAADEIETAINRHDMALKEIVREYVADASQLAKDYHHMLRQAWSEYSDTEFPPFADDGLVDFDRVLWQSVHGVANTDYPGLKYRDVKSGSNKFGVTMDDLWPSMDNVDDAQQFIGDMISAALRSQTQRSIRRDPTKPSWARVPQGKSCAFCTMLASRGFTYTSEESAGGDGNKYHDDCHCRIIPSWGKQTLTGYDPDKYYAMYKSAQAASGDDTTVQAVLREMRRLHPNGVRDGVSPKPDVRWSGAARPPSVNELHRLSDYGARMPDDRFTEIEKTTALRDWAGTAYERINDYCFGGKPTDGVESLIARIDEAIADHITQDTFTVYRQIRLETFGIESDKDIGTLRLGQVFDHAGYMACSTDLVGKEVGGETGRIAVRLLVPSGDHAVYLEPVTHVKSEYEVLLQRNRSLQYVGAGKLENGAPILYCRLV
jgi:hypothetical protein